MPFCLFDGCVTNEEKDKIAETLLIGKGHHAAVPKKRKRNRKPKFPEEVNEEPPLVDLTEYLWYFWGVTEHRDRFFTKRCKKLFSLDEKYFKQNKRANMITVVNDCSERGMISLATDFQSSSI